MPLTSLPAVTRMVCTLPVGKNELTCGYHCASQLPSFGHRLTPATKLTWYLPGFKSVIR